MKYIQKLDGLEGKVLRKNSVIYYTGEDVTVLDSLSSIGIITEQKKPMVYNRDEIKQIYQYFCIIGAIMSKNDKDEYTIWNTNENEQNYWDPKSDVMTDISDQYGTVIAICVGKGLWASLYWSGLKTEYSWAFLNTNLLNTYHAENIYGNGWDGTEHMFTQHSDELITGKNETIWKHLLNESTDDYYLYIPSKFEILELLENLCDKDHTSEQVDGTSPHTFNKNIGKLFNIQGSKLYSTSSQYASMSEYVKYIYCADLKSTTKNTKLLSIALIHFKDEQDSILYTRMIRS